MPVLFALFLSSGCPAPILGRPAWVVSRQHENFPLDRYMLGIGEGASREQAERNARRDLLESLTTRYSSVLQELHRAARLDKTCWGFSAYHVEQGVKWDNPATPTEWGEPVYWSTSDGARHAVIMSMDKGKTASLILAGIESREKACTQSAQEAEGALNRDRNPYRALVGYIHALEVRSLAEQQRALLKVLGVGMPAPAGPTLHDLLGHLAKIIDGIELKPVRGDAQRADATGSLVSPLVSGAYLVEGSDRFPIKELPLVYRFPKGKEPLQSATTDVGNSTVPMKNLPLVGKESSRITVRLDSGKILKEAGLDPADNRFSPVRRRLEKPVTVFSYFAPGQAGLRVMVLIEETLFGQPVQVSQTAKTIEIALRKQGFDLVKPGVAFEDLALIESLEEAPDVVRDHADLLVYGNLDAELSRVVNENFMFCQAYGKIQAVQLGTKRLLYAHENNVQGAGQDEYAACQRALDAFTKKAVPEMVTTIGKLTAQEAQKP